jgi:hypothetical protein
MKALVELCPDILCIFNMPQIMEDILHNDTMNQPWPQTCRESYKMKVSRQYII